MDKAVKTGLHQRQLIARNPARDHRTPIDPWELSGLKGWALIRSQLGS